MKTYARIQDGQVAEFFSTDDDITQMFYPSLVWVDVTDITPAPAYGSSATETDSVWSFGSIAANP
jgi:hypothetical protein